MKIKYYYFEQKSSFGHDSFVSNGFELLMSEDQKEAVGIYMSCLHTLTQDVDRCKEILSSIELVVSGAKTIEAIGLNDSYLTVHKNYIQLDIDIDDSLIDQPEGRFTHDQIRKAVEGKIKFLNMEKKVGVELIVDIG